MTAAITQTTKKKQQQIDVNATIESIWKRYLGNNLAPQILHRGFSYANNIKQQDVLITGMNPIYYQDRKHENNIYSFGGILHTHTVDNYWKFLRTMLVSPCAPCWYRHWVKPTCAAIPLTSMCSTSVRTSFPTSMKHSNKMPKARTSFRNNST